MERSKATKELELVINKYIRPATFPLAIKLQKKKIEYQGKYNRPLKDGGHKLAFCQAITLARRLGWTIIFSKEDHDCPVGAVVMGYYSPKKLLEGNVAYPFYAETMEIGRIMEQSNKFLPQKSVKEIWISPLHRANFHPDIIIVYGNSAQMARMAQGANYKTGKGVESKAFGRMACSSYIARTYIDNECTLVIPGGGERVFANTMDEELIFSIPSNRFKDVAFGIEAVHKEGLSRYPTYFYGMNIKPNFPDKYFEIIEKE